MDPGVAAHLGLGLEPLTTLTAQLSEEYRPEAFGLTRYGSIEPLVARAVASDLTLSLCGGVGQALLDLTLAARRYARLAGPTGRAMPGPDTTIDERIELAEMDAASVEAFRAVGSGLDCLAGLCALLLGLPRPVQTIDAACLVDAKTRPPTSSRQRSRWENVRSIVRAHSDRPAPGWLAWAIETRNAALHRGELLRIWVPRPSPRQSFAVVSRSPPQYLVRFEERLRREPWLPDMHALRADGELEDLYLTEPATATLAHLRDGTAGLVRDVVTELLATASDADGYVWPTDAWKLDERRDHPRVADASRFRGFDPSYPQPTPHHLRMSHQSAKRPALAQRLRDLILDDEP